MDENGNRQTSADGTLTKWYVVSAPHRNETRIRDDLRRHGFNCYLPMRYELCSSGGHRQRRLVPAISGLLFVRSSHDALKDYFAASRLPAAFWLSGRAGHRQPVVVAEDDMQHFMRVTQQVEQQLAYFRPGELRLQAGERIRVHGGVFDGVEGVLVRVPGRRSRQLVVAIPGISAVAVALSPDVVEIVDRSAEGRLQGKKPTRSTDADGDLRRLFTLASEMLFAPPHRVEQENEYNLLVVELRRTLQRVATLRGYTAQREGEIALPLYMATRALGLPAADAATRLLAAAGALKPVSLLRLRLQLYYALLAPDEALLADVKAQVQQWAAAPLSEQKRQLRDELLKLTDRPDRQPHL